MTKLYKRKVTSQDSLGAGHGIILLTSTIGFPNTFAPMSWVYDILGGEMG